MKSDTNIGGTDASRLFHADERLDDLQRNGLMILQKTAGFRFGTDAVLLADFAPIRKNDRAADLGAGTGVLSLLLSDTEKSATFDLIEIQPDMADMARRSVEINGLSDRVRVYALDMREAHIALGREGHTLVVCNPPYYPRGTAFVSEKADVETARHASISLSEIAQSGASLLKNGGRMALCYPASGAFELMCALRGARLEPKRCRLVQDAPERPPRLLLLDAVKNGRPGLHWLSPLLLREEGGAPSAEWKRIYGTE